MGGLNNALETKHFYPFKFMNDYSGLAMSKMPQMQ